MTDTQKKYLKERVARLITTQQGWRKKVLALLADRQTDGELESETTHQRNGVGFNSFDAPILTGIYHHLVQTGWVSVRQDKVLAYRLPKYSDQVVDHLIRECPEWVESQLATQK